MNIARCEFNTSIVTNALSEDGFAEAGTATASSAERLVALQINTHLPCCAYRANHALSRDFCLMLCCRAHSQSHAFALRFPFTRRAKLWRMHADADRSHAYAFVKLWRMRMDQDTLTV